MKFWMSVFSNLLIFTILFYRDVFCKSTKKNELITQILSSQTQEIAHSKQFIGSSVIGGLMWPVLITLTISAVMARIPDFFQRILTGTGGLQRNYRSKRSEFQEANLNEALKLLEKSFHELRNLSYDDLQ
ncbi:hypothetical protein CDAR_455141 [Caerostris darwini]|uniref:Uncharacterized protein n=1 Tax=Caerostris darwini TaxID=1538125 RepID=A0AAV4REM2_9ARAC|nr:hypothetical protein CDAR_455141 [Caerostris darwini]